MLFVSSGVLEPRRSIPGRGQSCTCSSWRSIPFTLLLLLQSGEPTFLWFRSSGVFQPITFARASGSFSFFIRSIVSQVGELIKLVGASCWLRFRLTAKRIVRSLLRRSEGWMKAIRPRNDRTSVIGGLLEDAKWTRHWKGREQQDELATWTGSRGQCVGLPRW